MPTFMLIIRRDTLSCVHNSWYTPVYASTTIVCQGCIWPFFVGAKVCGRRLRLWPTRYPPTLSVTYSATAAAVTVVIPLPLSFTFANELLHSLFHNDLSISNYDNCYGWWRGSVVRMSVFGRRTFPALCLLNGWQETTLWLHLSANGQPTRPTQPSIPP